MTKALFPSLSSTSVPFHIKYNLAYGANNNGENKEKSSGKKKVYCTETNIKARWHFLSFGGVAKVMV